MGIELAERYMNDTIPAMTIGTAASQKNSSARVNTSLCERRRETLSLFGETSRIEAAKQESTARRSGTKERIRAASLFDKRTRLLIAAGLVRGITPISIQRELGAPIPDFVSSWLDGDGVAKRRKD